METNHARILWQVTHTGFSEWFGDFSGATGTAHFDPAKPSVDAVDLTIPTASVSTPNSTLDGELKSAADIGLDGVYQYATPHHDIVSLNARYMHERGDLAAS